MHPPVQPSWLANQENASLERVASVVNICFRTFIQCTVNNSYHSFSQGWVVIVTYNLDNHMVLKQIFTRLSWEDCSQFLTGYFLTKIRALYRNLTFFQNIIFTL